MKELKLCGKKRLCIALFLIFSLALCAKSGVAEHKDTVITPLGNNQYSMVYQECMFVKQDAKWVTPEKARSMKNSGCFDWVVVQEGKEKYPVEIVDYNMTSITIKYTDTLPVTIYRKDETKLASYSTPKEAIDSGAYIQKTAKANTDLKNGVTLRVSPSDIIKIGNASTYLESQLTPGLAIDLWFCSGGGRSGWSAGTFPQFLIGYSSTWNNMTALVAIPFAALGLDVANVTYINSLTYSIYRPDPSTDHMLSIYQVFTDWGNQDAAAWTGAGFPNWDYATNGGVAWGGLIQGTYRNLTAMTSTITRSSEGNWINFTLPPSIVNSWFDGSIDNFGFNIRSNVTSGEALVEAETSDYTTDVSKRPMYFITYTTVAEAMGPTWNSLTTNASTTTLKGGNVSFGVKLADETALSYAYLELNGSGSFRNYTLVALTGTSQTINLTNTTWNEIGATVCGRFWFNDTANHANQTDNTCFIIADDITFPTWFNVYNNASTITEYGGSVNWTANLSDDTGLNSAWLEHNTTIGSMINETPISFGGTKNVNVSQNVYMSGLPTNYVCGRFWFKDTAVIGNLNVTDWSCFTVTNTIPPSWKSITNNASIVSINQSNVSVGINLYDVALSYAWLELNDTGSWYNKSRVMLNGTITTLNETFKLNSSVGKTVCAKYWFNDTMNLQNQSDTTCFVVRALLQVWLKDLYTGNFISNFTATLNDSLIQSSSTTTSSIRFKVDKGDYEINFTNIANNTYFNTTFIKVVNTDLNYVTLASTYQSIIWVTAFDKITGIRILPFNVSANNTPINSTTAGYTWLRVKAGTYRVWANSSNTTYPYNEYNDSITVLPLQNKSIVMFFHVMELNVTAKTFFGNVDIMNFSINLTNPAYGYSEVRHTTNGTIFFNISLGTYSITIWNTSYEIDNTSLTFTGADTPYNYTFKLLTAGNTYLRIYDEETLAFITSNVSVDLLRGTQTINYTTGNGTLLLTGLLSGTPYELRYTAPEYRARQYFFTIPGSGAEVIDLYLLNSTTGSLILFTIYDESGIELENATLKLLRYYPIKSGYVTVAMTKSDFNGYALLDAVLYTPFYQLVVDYEGRTIFESGEIKMTSITRNIFVDTTTDFFQTYSQIRNFYYIFNFDNSTGLFSFTYSSTANLISEVCLNVVKIGAKWEDVCNNCQTSPAGTITCNITSYGFDGAYNAQGQVKSGNIWYVVGELSEDFIEPLSFSTNMPMLFLAFIFIAGIATISLANPIIAMILSVFGAIALGSTKIFTLSEMGWIGIIITLIIIALAMYRRKA